MLDHVHDKNYVQLVQISHTLPLPDFVKEAELTTEEDISSIPSNCFADKVHRLYPTHTKADTWLSLAYFHKLGFDVPRSGREVIEAMLNKAAQFWKISPEDISKMKQSKVTSDQKDKGIQVLYQYEGSKLASASLHNADDWNKTASDLIDKGEKFPYSTRRDVSRQLLMKQASCKAEPSHEVIMKLQKIAGYGTTSKESLMEFLKTRASIYKSLSTEFSNHISKYAVELEKRLDDDFVKPEMLDKVASAVDMCDTYLDLKRHYKRAFTRPEWTLYQLTMKEAQDYHQNAVELKNGQLFSKTQINAAKVNLTDFLSNTLLIKTASDEELYKALEGLTRDREIETVTEIIQEA